MKKALWATLLLAACGMAEAPQEEVPVPPANDTVETVVEEEPVVTAPPTAYIDIESKPIDTTPLQLTPRQITLAKGDTFYLNVPEQYNVSVAAEGLRWVRFMDQSPDGRIFIAEMYNRSDREKGTVKVLSDYNAATGRYNSVTTYLTKLRNPNSLAFYTDKAGQHWLYIALTHQLVRYPYQPGDTTPSGEPEVLATYPDYGLSYKYGGWHLTRTVVIKEHKVYVAVGSSCNVCEEKEEIRASVSVMNPDGSDQRIIATGVRNAVGLEWVEGKLYATNMGADHLGDDRPEDVIYAIEEGKNYGWPYYYQYQGQIVEDTTQAWEHKTIEASDVPLAYAVLQAHDSPLDLKYFDHTFADNSLKNYFLTALHGSGYVSKNKGHAIVRFKKGTIPEVFVDGFVNDGERYGRPCGLLRLNERTLLFTDDRAGVVYRLDLK